MVPSHTGLVCIVGASWYLGRVGSWGQLVIPGASWYLGPVGICGASWYLGRVDLNSIRFVYKVELPAKLPSVR